MKKPPKAPPPVFVAEDDGARIDALAESLGVELDSRAWSALLRFAELVAQWNTRIDLTAARDAQSLVEVLFADALILAREDLVPKRARVVDIGAGAGAPGLVLALLRPDLDVTLVEPLRKRVAFLRTAIGSDGGAKGPGALAPRVRVVEGRVEPNEPRVEGMPFDLALSRATFTPDVWLPTGLVLAPRVLVLTAADEPPVLEGTHEIARVEYEIPSTRAPRRITAHRRAPNT